MKYVLLIGLLFIAACGKGDRGDIGPQGQSIVGATGPIGAPGVSCSVAAISLPYPSQAPNGGALITCGSTSTIVANGKDGISPPATYAISAVIDVCGASGGYDEVLLKLADGSIIASFSQNGSALTTRLTALPNGSYQTTDSQQCNFSIAQSGNTRTISWSGGSYSFSI